MIYFVVDFEFVFLRNDFLIYGRILWIESFNYRIRDVKLKGRWFLFYFVFFWRGGIYV